MRGQTLRQIKRRRRAQPHEALPLRPRLAVAPDPDALVRAVVRSYNRIMKTFLIVLIVISMVSVLGVLMAGVILMGRGGAANDRWGNRLMRARVGLQVLAVVLLMILFLVYQQ